MVALLLLTEMPRLLNKTVHVFKIFFFWSNFDVLRGLELGLGFRLS